MALGLALGAGLLPSVARADTVSGQMQGGYGRLSFTVSKDAKVSATTTGGVLAISFGTRTDLNPAAVAGAMSSVLSAGHADADGKTLRFTLTVPVKLHVSQQGTRAVVDLAPTSFNGTMPDLPPPAKAVAKPVDPASLPQIKLRTGTYPNFTRLVFDFPKDVGYSVFPGAGKMTVRFNTPVRMDVSMIARFTPPWVKNAAWRLEGNTTLVEFETDSDSGYHDFKDGTHVVLDVLAPKTDGAAYAPPGSARPDVTAMKPLPKDSGAKGVSSAQARAIAETAQTLQPQKAKPDDKKQAKAEEKPAHKTGEQKATEQKPAEAAKQAEAAPVETKPQQNFADGQRTRDGVLITFHGAGPRASAVFVRGLTAWIVLDDNPGFDVSNLQKSLGDYALQVQAVSSQGLGILRLTLKAPADIAATNDHGDLKVAIGTKVVNTAQPLGLARNQTDPSRQSLSTLLPAATHVYAVPDPATGDVLTIVPGAAGRAVPQKRVFVDFALLRSAAGLVITPFSDDLRVKADQSRIVIARPGGLSLTSPQLPVAKTPAALARFGEGPSFMDFKTWGALKGGSFLATERQLSERIAHQPSGAGITGARLDLARFYLAHRFGAEALGLIDLVQSHDPALMGDAQLTTMRAAAAYMLGRYRQAYSDLSGPGFDSVRHAAFWRGLTEAGLENWKAAHAHLEQADPVLNRYPDYWQAEARLADADAAMGIGRLDLADSALLRLPKTLTPRQALARQLAEARLMAAENRYHDAAPLFRAVARGGDERLAAAAVFHQTNAALGAGAITVPQAIDALERLRFRWRGDGLELRTLRKLAALYFGRNQWREGLKTLRVATQNFPHQEASRLAQDEMRAAFVNLFLKGGADKMKPVDALALFYDNLDLTPIGPDGDEMIRRISDRLVTVDLLGPAASLLAYQVDKRLDGVAKAQVSTRLASIYLMDHKPDLAVKVIRASDITGLPAEEMQARLLLEARAFAALKQWDNALDLIALDETADSRRLRADIYWESGNWAVAGQKTEELLAARWSEPSALNAEERTEVLRAAVAYSLAADTQALARLNEHFSAKMKSTPDANLFAVLAAPLDAHGLAFRDAAAKIAGIDTLQSFMKDFNRRYAEPPRS
jgi:hypothetical protein